MAIVAGTKEQNRAVPGAPAKPEPARSPASRPSATALPGRSLGRSPASEAETPGGTLVIGREIQVKGQIGSCETLVVEGRLEAEVQVGSLHLSEDGFFDGMAEVEDADVAGRFEGSLVVRGNLLLRPTAKVRGEIRYGRIVIEGGGEISGNVEVLPRGEGQAAGEN